MTASKGDKDLPISFGLEVFEGWNSLAYPSTGVVRTYQAGGVSSAVCLGRRLVHIVLMLSNLSCLE